MSPTPATHVSVDVLALRFNAAARTVELAVHRRPLDPFAGDLALPGVLLLADETIAQAGSRALAKVAATPLATGQLLTFDEPNRDPRGPTLSIATWAVLSPQRPDGATWVPLDAPPPLAFDHDAILATTRPLLAGLLWRDLPFTRAIVGETFTAGDAVALTQTLLGRVDRGNLNRELARIDGLERGEAVAAGAGRPGRVWRWTD
ncbi:NUDIX hydrolase [Serinibacter arcticus]|uniref:Putative DNA hydrolase n=1 Tax=Serinibacter arcticus TaxID=1655435 RepID=A0A4Z1DZX9_9MICO|nr:NUDIX hydrolase [Serinibacter arcticus]TGO04630.1 putative DNA hydrolase [Serinibacter arcticus]